MSGQDVSLVAHRGSGGRSEAIFGAFAIEDGIMLSLDCHSISETWLFCRIMERLNAC